LTYELEQIEALSKHTLVENLGIRFTYLSDDRIEATMPVNKRTCQVEGLLHGGASLALAETLAGVGSMTRCGSNETPVGVQVSGNHLAAAVSGDTVRAVATIVHKGRTSHLWNVDVYVVSSGVWISSVRVLNRLIKKKDESGK
jgi:uncharacterized protein (TIGR00369 family)